MLPGTGDRPARANSSERAWNAGCAGSTPAHQNHDNPFIPPILTRGLKNDNLGFTFLQSACVRNGSTLEEIRIFSRRFSNCRQSSV
jgi:hypothetical protein